MPVACSVLIKRFVGRSLSRFWSVLICACAVPRTKGWVEFAFCRAWLSRETRSVMDHGSGPEHGLSIGMGPE